MIRTFILTAVLSFVRLCLVAQPINTKPNIPLTAIVNMAYRDAPVHLQQVFYDRGDLWYLVDMSAGAKDSFLIRELKSDYQFGDTARRYGTIYKLSLSILNIEPGTLKLRLSLTRYEGKEYVDKVPIGFFYDTRDIECDYDFLKKQWKYQKTLKVWDY